MSTFQKSTSKRMELSQSTELSFSILETYTHTRKHLFNGSDPLIKAL